MKITLATNNPGKLREFKELAGDAAWLTLLPAPPDFDPEETGSTFEENATIKARAAASATGLPAVSDDSGLVVGALGGAPGINSARYCEGTDADRRLLLLKNMEGVPEGKRAASYICAIVLVNAQGKILYSTNDNLLGHIAFSESGSNGFGYDSIFYLPQYNATAAEISREIKNKISHRAKAWHAMLTYLDSYRKQEVNV